MGFFIYFMFFKKPKEIPEGELPEEVKNDKIPPSTAILSPEDKSWHNQDFMVSINDSDLGAGLVDFMERKKGCLYFIEDLGTNQTGSSIRKCDPVEILISVGEGKVCSSSYSKDDISMGKCKVSTKSFDRAGNNSGWKSKVFNVDLMEPQVEKIKVEQDFELNKNYLFRTKVSDNSKIIGCWFYLNGQIIDVAPKITPLPCENETQCDVSINYEFAKEGDFLVRFGCLDVAGNMGFGELTQIKVKTNHPPQISSCKVNPTQGTTETEFQFEVTATDPDGDEISYLWDFGDGLNSIEDRPIHRYNKEGVFYPRSVVSDKKGGESESQTAWVTVVKE